MKKYVHVETRRPCCCYLHDIEYTRRKIGGPIARDVSLGRPLYLQVLRPMGRPGADGEKLPLVLFLVGGGYRQPKVKLRIPWLVRLAERGFVVAMPEYRGTETDRFPAPVADVRTALRFMRSHAEEFSIDTEKVVLMGSSAGGHLALLAAYTGETFSAPDDDLAVPADVRGVIDLYGPTDLTRMTAAENMSVEGFAASIGAQLTGSLTPAAFERATAPTVVSGYVTPAAQIPPTLIAHGDADEVVPIGQSELLYEALRGAGKPAQFYCLEGAGHADMGFFQSEMIDVYEEFIRRVTR